MNSNDPAVPVTPVVEDSFEAARRAFFSRADSKPQTDVYKCHISTEVKIRPAPMAEEAMSASDSKQAEQKKTMPELAHAH